MILPGFEAQSELGEFCEAFAELGVAHQPRRDDTGGVAAELLAGIPRYAVPDSAQPATADGDFSLQQRSHVGSADGQVAAADNCLGDTPRTVIDRGANR